MPARRDSASANRGGTPNTASHTCERRREARERLPQAVAARSRDDYLQGQWRKSGTRTEERILPTKSFSSPTAVPIGTYVLLCMTISSSPSSDILSGLPEQGGERTHLTVLALEASS